MVKLTDDNPFPFLAGGGEMGQRTRSFDWVSTALGSPEAWPQSLRTTLSIILNSAFPMLLFWGRELTMFYNDAFLPSLGRDGKHPDALGQPGSKVWAELWHIIGPMLDSVIARGEAVYHENLLVPYYRNGRMEDTYFTFSYSPVNDESGRPAGVFVTCTETTQNLVNLKLSEESKDQLHFAIEATQLGTWDYNPATNMLTGNTRLKNWFGLGDDEAVDLNVAMNVISPEDQERVKAAIQRALQYSSGGVYDIQYTIIHPRDKPRIVRARGRTWFNSEHIPTRFNGTLQDVTEQVGTFARIEQVVMERTESLHRSNQELSQIAYITSHDLQEPARKVSVFAEMLRKALGDRVSDQARNYLDKIDTSSQRMLYLIRDLLSLSKLSKNMQVYETVDLTKTLDDTLNDFELLVAETNCVIESDGLPVIEAVPVQMAQLFSNLVSNALKFSSPDRRPCLNIKAVRATQEDLRDCPLIIRPRDYWKVLFADNGIGFPQESAADIFNIFRRLHTTTEYKGTGIGLAICRKIAENHDGCIYAESSPGNGAVFTVILPASHT